MAYKVMMLPMVPQVCKLCVDASIELQGYEHKPVQIVLNHARSTQHTPARFKKTELPADKTVSLCVFWGSIKDEKSVRSLTASILSMPGIVRVKSSVQFFISKQNLSLGNL